MHLGETCKLEQRLTVLTLRMPENRQRKELWASLLVGPTLERCNTDTLCLVTCVHLYPFHSYEEQPRALDSLVAWSMLSASYVPIVVRGELVCWISLILHEACTYLSEETSPCPKVADPRNDSTSVWLCLDP